MEANDGNNTNHGGFSGFHNKVWQWEELPDGIRFSLYSPDGEGGFPGNIRVITDYRFNEDNELSVRHYAETDCATYINMTNHAYLYEPVTGRNMTVMTDLPAVLLYTAGYYERPDTAVCLETQFYPDTPSHSDFPSCLVLPEKAYEHCTLFHFQVQKEE